MWTCRRLAKSTLVREFLSVACSVSDAHEHLGVGGDRRISDAHRLPRLLRRCLRQPHSARPGASVCASITSHVRCALIPFQFFVIVLLCFLIELGAGIATLVLKDEVCSVLLFRRTSVVHPLFDHNIMIRWNWVHARQLLCYNWPTEKLKWLVFLGTVLHGRYPYLHWTRSVLIRFATFVMTSSEQSLETL